jgi:lauroyl/myristoyl acyltransferase
VRATFYREEQRWFREFAEGLGSAPDDLNRAFVASMMGNILYDLTRMASLLPKQQALVTFEQLHTSKFRFARTLANTIEASMAYQASKFATVGETRAEMRAEMRDSNAHLITHAGFEHLQAAHQRGRGVLLVTYHGSMHQIATIALAHRLRERDIFSVSQTNAVNQERRQERRKDATSPVAFREISAHTRIGIEGQRQLRQGAIVQLANDVGYEKSGTFPFAIGGRVFQLKPGFAELAINTGAAIVPHYATIAPSGEIINRFFPPLDDTSNPRTRQEQVMELLHLYTAFLEESWRQSPESLRWFVMKHYLNFPLASR